MDEQVGRRFVGIAHVFPAYSVAVIEQLAFGHWVALAIAYDEHVAELERERSKLKGAARGRS